MKKARQLTLLPEILAMLPVKDMQHTVDTIKKHRRFSEMLESQRKNQRLYSSEYRKKQKIKV